VEVIRSIKEKQPRFCKDIAKQLMVTCFADLMVMAHLLDWNLEGKMDGKKAREDPSGCGLMT